MGDAYGCAKLIAQDQQLSVVKEGAMITVRNCHANVRNEHLRLEVDKWGKIEPSSEKVDKVEISNNLSDVEYEMVSVRH